MMQEVSENFEVNVTNVHSSWGFALFFSAITSCWQYNIYEIVRKTSAKKIKVKLGWILK